MKAAATSNLSASGSSSIPIVVICPRLRARYPSIPSVIEARIKTADARISRSPVRSFANRGVQRIHIRRGMAAMRVSVIELGRFTR
jgi:hypothetical protein